MKYKAFVEKRSQKRVGTPPKAGPDTYFVVQVVPVGKPRLKVLNTKIAAKRGIDIIFCGDGYSNRQTKSTSMYNLAKTKAFEIATKINKTGEYNGPRTVSK